MKYKGIIFDLDGVLCSTDRFHFEAWKQTAEEVGAPFDETINMKLRGVSRMESLEIILSGSSKTFTDTEKERLATEKNDRYRKLLAQMSPADMPTAVRDALTALHNAGLKLAVGSSSKNAAYILERLDANRYFDAVCDGTMIAHSKPHQGCRHGGACPGRLPGCGGRCRRAGGCPRGRHGLCHRRHGPDAV